MTIYVDELPESGWGKWNGGAHMLASDLEELHELAKEIGLKRSWFQDSTFPHYDLTRSKRRLAVQKGAVEIEAGHIPDDVLMLNRKDRTYETHGERKRRYNARVQNVRQGEA